MVYGQNAPSCEPLRQTFNHKTFVFSAASNDPWVELDNQCGTPIVAYENLRIVNGESVDDIRTWPWASYMTYSGSFFCGAELISKNWALTAAHCM